MSPSWVEMGEQQVNCLQQAAIKIITANICRVGEDKNWASRLYKELIVNEEVIQFKINYGAQVNAIPRKYVGQQKIRKQKLTVWNYINVFGTVVLNCKVPAIRQSRYLKFVVVTDSYEPMLGMESSLNCAFPGGWTLTT